MIASTSFGSMHSYYGSMTKAELHLHLEGSVEAETLLAIDPSLTREEIGRNMNCRTFPEFLRSYEWVTRRLRTPQDYALATRHLLDRLSSEPRTSGPLTLSPGLVFWPTRGAT